MDYRTLTGAPGKNISVRLPAAELIKLQTAEFFFAARLQKNGTADVTFKEPDIEKASVLLGISIKEPAGSGSFQKRLGDAGGHYGGACGVGQRKALPHLADAGFVGRGTAAAAGRGDGGFLAEENGGWNV